jgi:hypothetical protein
MSIFTRSHPPCNQNLSFSNPTIAAGLTSNSMPHPLNTMTPFRNRPKDIEKLERVFEAII